MEELCDISLYGGWPEGTEHGIFRAGFSLLALQLAVMVLGRLGHLHSAAPRELRQDLPCPMECCSSARGCCCTPIFGAFSSISTLTSPLCSV